MQPIHEELFGDFPRAIGSPMQNLVYSKEEFELVFESLIGQRNLYSSVGQRWPGGKTVCDKVFFDFDTPHKVDGDIHHEDFDEEMSESEKFSAMRNDESVADDVLGDVLADAKSLIRESERRDVPTISVFSGGGIHVHQLYQPEKDPEDEMESIGWAYTENLELTTADTVIFGDTKRLTRIPNSQRIDDTGQPIELYLRPYTPGELLERSVTDLLNESREPRPDFNLSSFERPCMPFYEEYPTKKVHASYNDMERSERATPVDVDHEKKTWLKHIVKLPCLLTEVTRDNPDHDVRWSLVAYCFNIGMKPDEVFKVIEQLDWSNFKPDMTRKQIENIWDGGQKSEHGCRWMMERGFCVYPEEPENCPTYKWGGSEPYFEWPR